MRSRFRILAVALTALALVGTLSACGDDDDDAAGDAAEATTTSAAEAAQGAVCAAKDDLRESVDTVVSDIGDGNFGEAQENVAGVEAAADSLGQAVEDLDADERSQLEPLVDDIRGTVSSLGESENLAELGASLDSIVSTIDDIVTEVESMGCD